jgi:hypothetical protein
MCGRTGLAEMSDDKSSNIGDYHTRLEAVPEGFEIKGNDVICSTCQVSLIRPVPNVDDRLGELVGIPRTFGVG